MLKQIFQFYVKTIELESFMLRLALNSNSLLLLFYFAFFENISLISYFTLSFIPYTIASKNPYIPVNILIRIRKKSFKV